MTIYHNPRCTKSRQTLALIEENGGDFIIKEYLKEPPTKAELKNVIALLGISPEELIRKGEAEFKNNFKGKSLSDDQWIEAMIAYPKLIERPIVIEGDKAVIGRPPENVLELL
ncbi:arsenate reductase (glutaredoxin) [Ekhidna sp.]